jgi:hypothetical protein
MIGFVVESLEFYDSTSIFKERKKENEVVEC